MSTQGTEAELNKERKHLGSAQTSKTTLTDHIKAQWAEKSQHFKHIRNVFRQRKRSLHSHYKAL